MILSLLLACKGEPLPVEWCADADTALPAVADAPTWYADIAPIVEQKCARCHEDGGPAPYPLTTYEEVAAVGNAVRSAVEAERMPPWLAEPCCQDWYQDFDLTAEERARLLAWIDAGMEEGDADSPAESRDPIGGVSRVDLTVSMPEAYTPNPPEGTNDENRCFVLDWPTDEEVRVTGVAPRPGAREIVHHLIIYTITVDDLEAVRARDAADDRPGFDCAGGLGEFPTAKALGGSLMGGDYPRGIGNVVAPDSTVVLQIHYSTSGLEDVPADQTSVDFRIAQEGEEVVDAGAMVIANAGWLVGETMVVPAGEEDVGYWYQFQPLLFTGGKPVNVEGVTPHLHRFASRIRVLAVHPDGTTTCLLEIGDWEFGWEQAYWFAEPVRFEPEDALYLECRFDNSAANQPDGVEARDIAWGDNDQDMCAAFLSFTAADP